jgi:cellulose synthase/poly-beta-1,6-N-acetylglucosamine synthase-like glycosyltransferase
MYSPFVDALLGWELLFFAIMSTFWISIYLGARKLHAKPKPFNDEPPVSVVIPVYNKVRYVADTINAALGLDYKNKEIIVVNDGSTDGSLGVCKKFEGKGLIKLINISKNGGKANALNAGIRSANGEYILTMDGDSDITSDSLRRMMGYFEDKTIGAVAGMVRTKGERTLLERFQFLEYFQQAFQRLIQGFFKSVLVLPGPISLFRKSAIKDVGWFDNSTIVEDWDMTMKLHKKGYRIVSDENSFSDTIPPTSIGDWWKQRIRWSRGGIQIAINHKDVLGRSNNKALTHFMFPIHIMWLFVPALVIPTMIYVMIPSQVAFTNLFADLSTLFSAFWNWATFEMSVDIPLFYKMLDQIIFDFIDPKNMTFPRSMGYLSGLAFLAFSYLTLKSFNREFRPRDLITIALMPIYWFMLNAVYVYSIFSEAMKRKLIW